MHNPNYKGKNYDPNFQAKCAEATHSTPHNSNQQQNPFMMTNQYKAAYNKPTSTYGASNNTLLTNSSDIVGEVTLKTLVDGYQLLKVNEMISTSMTTLKKEPKRHQNPRYTSMRPRSKLWAKLPKTLATQNKSLSKRWRCTSISATRTWRMSPSPTHRTDYQSITDLMATIKMYIAQTSIL